MTTLRRRLFRALGRLLWLCPGLLVVLAPAAAGYASETNPLKVYGHDRLTLRAGIDYWNRLAGKELLRYSGEKAPDVDASTITVGIGALDEHLAGRAFGIVGRTAISITVRPQYAGEWAVFAHELGHALGFPDYDTDGDTSSYAGVMSYVQMWMQPHPADDRVLLSNRRGPTDHPPGV